MGKILTIVLLLIVALLGLGFGWVSYQDKKELEERESAQAARLAQLEEQTSRLEETSSAAKAAEEQASARARQAEEAARMAEAQAKEADAQRQARVAELNEQLRQAADDRRAAQAQAERLAERMEALEVARQEAAQRLAELEAARARTRPATTTIGPDGKAVASEEDAEATQLAEKLAQQERELTQLREENVVLAQRTQALLDQQIAAEEAIVQAGGEIGLPVHEIMSPSARRYQAQRHRARVQHSEAPNP